MPDGLGDRLFEVYDRANRMTGGVLGIVRDAFARFGEARPGRPAHDVGGRARERVCSLSEPTPGHYEPGARVDAQAVLLGEAESGIGAEPYKSRAGRRASRRSFHS